MFCYFGEFALEIVHPATQALLLLAEAPGHFGHAVGPGLAREDPCGHDRPAQETVGVIAWRLMNPLPDTLLAFDGGGDGVGGWLSVPAEKLFFDFIPREVAGQGRATFFVKSDLVRVHEKVSCPPVQ